MVNTNGVISKFSKYLNFFFSRKKEEKNCKDLRVGKNLIEFAEIPTLESLIYIYIYIYIYC
jgi:hypothetical protein